MLTPNKNIDENPVGEKKVSWLELFFDLVFVTAVSFTTHLLVGIEHHPENMLFYLGEYLLMVFPMFWLWSGQTMFFNRFGEHLRLPELFMLPQMFFFILMTASLDFEFSHTYRSYLGSYLGLRLITILQYVLVSRKLDGPRKTEAITLARLFLPGVLIPVISLMFPGSWRYVIMYAGMAADMALPIFYGQTLKAVPVNLPHLAERFGLFVLITFGEALVSIVNILVGHTADIHALTQALLTFALIGFMWSSYFYAYEKVVDYRLKTNGQVLLYGHFIILVAVMTLAGGIELIQEGRLPKGILLGFLYGPVLMFLTVKNLVFYHHRKKSDPYYQAETALVLLALILAYLSNFVWDISIKGNLALALSGCGAESAIKRGLHRKLF